MERAGLTDVPVIGITQMGTIIKERPMASPAKLPAPFFASVVPSTTSTKIQVKIISVTRPASCETPDAQALAPVWVAVTSTPHERMRKSRAEPIKPPITWKIMYIAASFPDMRPLKNTPSVMAGLIWHPEIPPMVYAIVTTETPKATATVKTCAVVPHPPLKIAEPQPMKTSTIVPIISAKYFFIITFLYVFFNLATNIKNYFEAPKFYQKKVLSEKFYPFCKDARQII